MPRKKQENVITDQEIPKVVDFEKFAGMEASLYYCNHLNQFQLGDVIFEAIEDESNGYRSMMQEVRLVKTDAPRRSGDFLGIVTIEKVYENDFDGFHLTDKDGHIWLTFGTDNVEDHYPTFKFLLSSKERS